MSAKIYSRHIALNMDTAPIETGNTEYPLQDKTAQSSANLKTSIEDS